VTRYRRGRQRSALGLALSGRTDWQTTERVLECGAFESKQWTLIAEAVVESSESGARWLGVTYWQAVDRFSHGSVRARWTGSGGRLTLLGGLSLLRFGLPELSFSDEVVSCRFAIQGGLLAVRAGGSVTLSQRRFVDGVELTVLVEEYVPRLAARAGAPRWTGVLYAKGQSPFHAGVSRHYFDLLTASTAR
jgi:hypothetical protein